MKAILVHRLDAKILDACGSNCQQSEGCQTRSLDYGVLQGRIKVLTFTDHSGDTITVLSLSVDITACAVCKGTWLVNLGAGKRIDLHLRFCLGEIITKYSFCIQPSIVNHPPSFFFLQPLIFNLQTSSLLFPLSINSFFDNLGQNHDDCSSPRLMRCLR